jgi:hypothetical protein
MKLNVATLALTGLLTLSSLFAQQPPQDPLLRWMNQIAQHELQQREQAVDQIHTVAQAESRKTVVRAKFLKALGGLPDYNGPLHARTTGSLDAGSYTIEKVIARLGRVVLEVESRHSPEEIGNESEGPMVGDWMTNLRANLIGGNLPAMRAHDILRGVDLLAARPDVDRQSIRAFARGVTGVWLLLAAATDPRIEKVWLDRTPYSLRLALENSLATDLFDAVIPGFVLHWDLDDFVKAMGSRTVLWTDPTNWMGRVVALGPPFQYRYVLGDTTDFANAQDNEYIRELLE